MIKIAHIIASSGISAVVGAGRVKLIAIAEDITMQVLFLATYGDFLATFELQNIKLLQQLGCTVHCASNFENKAYNRYTKNLDDIGVIKHNVVFSRSCFTASNWLCFREIRRIICKNKIDIVDCHNAIVGVLARLACIGSYVKRVIYTPHSFFFYSGCPWKNRLIFRTTERALARVTDLLIAINMEDYQNASKMNLRGKAIYVPGVGVDTSHIKGIINAKGDYCKELGIPENATIITSIGELNTNKNHITAIRAFYKANLENTYYLICGIGPLENYLRQEICKMGLEDRIKLLGYRKDAKEILKMSDAFLLPTYREGLCVTLIEAMACGIPCFVSNIRGNTDLIDDYKGGRLFPPQDEEGLTEILQAFVRKRESSESWGEYNQAKAEKYDISNVRQIMIKEYSELIGSL